MHSTKDDISVPDNIYRCGWCDKIIMTESQEFCSGCGSKLNWDNVDNKSFSVKVPIRELRP